MNEIAEECDSEAIMWTLRSRAGFSGQEDADPDVAILKEAKAECAKLMMTCLAAALLLLSLRH